MACSEWASIVTVWSSPCVGLSDSIRFLEWAAAAKVAGTLVPGHMVFLHEGNCLLLMGFKAFLFDFWGDMLYGEDPGYTSSASFVGSRCMVRQHLVFCRLQLSCDCGIVLSGGRGCTVWCGKLARLAD